MAGSLMRFLMIGDQMEQVSISSRKITLADWPAIVEGLPCALCPVLVKICTEQRITEKSTLLSLVFIFINLMLKLKVS